MLTLGKWWVVQCDNRSYTVGREWEKKVFFTFRSCRGADSYPRVQCSIHYTD